MAIDKIICGTSTGSELADSVNETIDLAELSAADITTLDGQMTTVEGKVTTLEGEMNDVENDITTINADILALQTITIKDVTTPYTLLQADNGSFLVFNSADATVIVPDGLSLATNVMALNTGAGNVTFTVSTDTIRGSAVLGEESGMMSMTKITASIWQSSERV